MYNVYIGKLLDVVTTDTAVCYASITCARVLPGALASGFVGSCVARPAGISVGFSVVDSLLVSVSELLVRLPFSAIGNWIWIETFIFSTCIRTNR